MGIRASGMEIHKGYLYYSSALVVYRSKLTPGKLIPESKIEVVLTDDHPEGAHAHVTKPITFDDKGNMYVPFGAPSDNCQDINSFLKDADLANILSYIRQNLGNKASAVTTEEVKTFRSTSN